MRGKLMGYHYTNGVDRITPADAGKTAQDRCLSAGYEDHPRGCGENTAIAASIPISMGSPPRMRGKRIFSNRSCIHSRITPADAGKTVCVTFPIIYSLGSPPRMRGKP